MEAAGRTPFDDARARLHAESEVRKLFIDRIARFVGHAAHAAAGAIEQGERFQHVVHLRGLEFQDDLRASLGISGALEVSHPVLVEHDAAYGEIGGV